MVGKYEALVWQIVELHNQFEKDAENDYESTVNGNGVNPNECVQVTRYLLNQIEEFKKQ